MNYTVSEWLEDALGVAEECAHLAQAAETLELCWAKGYLRTTAERLDAYVREVHATNGDSRYVIPPSPRYRGPQLPF